MYKCVFNKFKRARARARERVRGEKREKTVHRKENRLRAAIESGCQDITSRGLKPRMAFNKWAFFFDSKNG